MSCDNALMKAPPPDMLYSDFDYGFFPPKAGKPKAGKKEEPRDRITINKKQAKREAFMVCGLMNSVNEALRYHKQQKCGSTANLEETYSIHDDPSMY
jgi:hypothetical protein